MAGCRKPIIDGGRLRGGGGIVRLELKGEQNCGGRKALFRLANRVEKT